MTRDRSHLADYGTCLALPALLLSLAAGCAEAPPPAAAARAAHPGDSDLVLAAKVVRVIDGDSAQMRLDSGPIEVRLFGIDAPEARAPFGREAAQALKALIAGRDVELVPVSQDRYERMVAIVMVDGTSVNEALVGQGQAWAYRQYLGEISGGNRYCELEAAARAAKKGLWSQPAGRWVPPWIYRQRERAPPGAAVPSGDYSGETVTDCVAGIGESGLKPLPQLKPFPPDKPLPQGAAPEAVQASRSSGCRIKGNINGKGVKIYHVPGDEHYEETRISTARGERWFCSEEEARDAGWRAAR